MSGKHKEIYLGQLHEIDEGGLYIDGEPIADEVAIGIEEHGKFLSVRYYISEQPIIPETVKLDWLKQLYTGVAESEYQVVRSEYTGYLWTDEELNVGGHNLLADLYTHEGKYLYMEIEFSQEKPKAEGGVMNEDSMLYWWEKVKDLDIPMPITEIIKWESTAEWHKTLEPIRDLIERMGLPVFLRTDHTSCKHDWKYTCYFDHMDFLYEHIEQMGETSFMSDLPVEAIVIREYIEMAAGFTAFAEMPVNPERRYFIRDGVIECRHPYWIYDAVAEGRPEDPDWRIKLRGMNKEPSEEVELLSGYATLLASAVEGYWSVDFCKASDGRWIFIDMATGERSWHPECPFSPERS